ncbi:MAG: hypothetical protein MUP70_15690 [Candidatus Aminicenantes bacterium]|nr:hypothetical protein [Candidatus Aminicenantes bacterium]
MAKRLYLLSFVVVLLLPFLSAYQGTQEKTKQTSSKKTSPQSIQEQRPTDSPQAEDPPPKYHLRITIYPTVSLSRYDYNNDLNLHELRAYVSLRLDAPHGQSVGNAAITVNGQKLEFQEDNYSTRIRIPEGETVDEVRIAVATPEGFKYSGSFRIPAWLRLSSPLPDIYSTDKDISVGWEFSGSAGPVDIIAYDFKDRDARRILDLRNTIKDGTTVAIPADKLPSSTILRIFAMQTWMFKQYLRNENLAAGSEINIIPWSQIFIRTRNP